jgi:hypothetical protein
MIDGLARPFTLIVIFAFLSWFTTWSGVLGLVSDGRKIGLLEAGVLAVLVGAFTAAMVFCVRGIFEPEAPRAARIAFVAGYFACMALSVVFGFGYYWQLLRAGGETIENVAEQAQQIDRALASAAASLTPAKDAMVLMQRHSETRAKLERQYGGSCGPSPPGAGPRNALRTAEEAEYRQDAVAFGTFVQKINARRKTFSATSGSLQKNGVDRGQLTTVIESLNAEVNTLRGEFDAGVNALKARTQGYLEQARKYSGQAAFVSASGEAFQCPDDTMARLLRDSAGAAASITPLDVKPVKSLDTAARSIAVAFSRLTTSMTQPFAKAGGLTKEDFLPLSIAAIVDFMLLMLSIVEMAMRPPREEDKPSSAGVRDPKVWGGTPAAPGTLFPASAVEHAVMLHEDEEWQRIQRNIVRIGGIDFAVERRRAETADDAVFSNLILELKRRGAVQLRKASRRTIDKALKERGHDIPRGGVDIWELHPDALADYANDRISAFGDRIVDL